MVSTPLTELIQQFHISDPERRFPILSGQTGPDGQLWTFDETASAFTRATARLIAFLDGTSTEALAGDTGLFTKPDVVIYLDKSARPVRWCVSAFWSQIGQGRPPFTGFLSIDRMNWFPRLGISVTDIRRGWGIGENGTEKHLDLTDLTARLRLIDADPDLRTELRHLCSRIRALFVRAPLSMGPEWADEVWRAPTVLDHKSVVLIDEVKSGGATLHLAQTLLRIAVPEAADIAGQYFWASTSRRLVDGQPQMGAPPVWYRSTDPWGRGVGDLDERYYYDRYRAHPTAASWRRYLGAIVASPPHHRGGPDGTPIIVTDRKARQLRDEIHHLAQEYRRGTVLLIPPDNWDLIRGDRVLEDQGLVLRRGHGVPNPANLKQARINRRRSSSSV